ncbi:pre-mRNA 3' end processing protein WDR33 [Vespula squamosa]|uniref:Pre-mRNA 3' end processing protein WDR33 n=1 Tax=Vespula squamosa TaxID=30214 RepID=A0ABD2AHF0_VESSQ
MDNQLPSCMHINQLNLNQEVQTLHGYKKEASNIAWHPSHEGLFCNGDSDVLLIHVIFLLYLRADKEVSIVWTLAWHSLEHILCSGNNDYTSKFWTYNRPGNLMRDKYNLDSTCRNIRSDAIQWEDIQCVYQNTSMNKSNNYNSLQDEDLRKLTHRDSKSKDFRSMNSQGFFFKKSYENDLYDDKEINGLMPHMMHYPDMYPAFGPYRSPLSGGFDPNIRPPNSNFDQNRHFRPNPMLSFGPNQGPSFNF